MTKLNKGSSEFFVVVKFILILLENFIKDPSHVSIYIARSLGTEDVMKTA